MDRWLGMTSATGDSIHTGQLSYEVEKQYGIEIQRGLDHEAALELAANKVAAKAKYFGNELVWTEGTDLNETLYMPNGATANDRDKAWENFADGMGIDPDKAHFAMVGQYGYITDDQGEPIEEIGLFPLVMIGNAYEQKMRDDSEGREARDLEDKLNDLAGNNRMFETSMNARTGFDDSAKILADGTTLGNFKNSDEEGRLLIRKQYDEENKGWLAKMAKGLVDFVHDVQAGKYQGEAAERFKSVASPDMLNRLESPPAKQTLSDRDVAGIREVDTRATEQKLKNARLIRSRAGEVKVAEEDLKPTMKESDLMDVPKAAYSGKTQDGKQIYNSKAFKGLSKEESTTVDSEGFVTEPYKDSLGIETIGIGHNLQDNPFDAEEQKKFGKNRDWAKEPMTKAEALWLFRRDFKDAKKDAKTTWPQYSRLSKNRQRVLADMTFNMGAKKFNPDQWPGLSAALDARPIDWNRVADAMKDSEWFKQVGDRAKKNIAQMKKG
jgi:lysozyme